MTSPLDSFLTITFVADVDTPAEFAGSAGRVLALSSPVQVGTGGRLAGIPGLVRQGVAGLEFLMMADVPGQSAGPGPTWAQQLRTDLTAALAAAHTERVALSGQLDAAITKLNQIIGGAARQADLLATKAEVDAIKAKLGA